MKTNKKFHQLALSLLAFVLILIVVSSAASAATLKVGSKEKYKTIQKAVNAAHSGDTIQVAYGTYKEDVKLDKQLTILGTKYPKVYGFDIFSGNAGGSYINGFSFQKDGVEAGYTGSVKVRNNYFYNCGIGLSGPQSANSLIMNNQLIGGSIYLYDIMADGLVIKGNTISKSKCGLFIGEGTVTPTVTGNTFKNCNYGVYFFMYEGQPGRLTTFTNNKYSGNKVNIGWGMNAPV